MNFNIKLNLSKLRKVKYLTDDGEQYICIPVKHNCIFNGQKGFYLELAAFQLQQQKYNESHLIKLSVTKEIFDKLTDEQKNKLPIVGSLSEFRTQIKMEELQNVTFSDEPKNAISDEEDDLPF